MAVVQTNHFIFYRFWGGGFDPKRIKLFFYSLELSEWEDGNVRPSLR